MSKAIDEAIKNPDIIAGTSDAMDCIKNAFAAIAAHAGEDDKRWAAHMAECHGADSADNKGDSDKPRMMVGQSRDFGKVQVGDMVVHGDSSDKLLVLKMHNWVVWCVHDSGFHESVMVAEVRTISRPPLRVGDAIQFVRPWQPPWGKIPYCTNEIELMGTNGDCELYQPAIDSSHAIRVLCAEEK